jgi:hypothetical protein
MELEKVENCLQLLKMYLEESIRCLLSISPSDKRAADFSLLYCKHMAKKEVLMVLLKSGDTSLKMVVLELLQLHEILLFRVKGLPVDYKSCDSYRSGLIDYVLSLKVGIVYPLFIEWLMVVFADVGEDSDKIELLCRSSLTAKTIALLTSHKTNSILVAKLIELLRVLFVNIEK